MLRDRGDLDASEDLIGSPAIWGEELRERLKMSFTRTTKAVVVSCSLASSDQITVDLTVTLYQIQARVLEAAYAEDFYVVTIVKPKGIGDLIDEDGAIMEHGKFSFDSTEKIAIGTELEIEITGVGTSSGQ